MSQIDEARKSLVRRILEGAGEASLTLRQEAFANSGVAGPVTALIDKVSMHADRITDEDIAAVMASGLSEDQVFEIVVCASIGQATRQYDTALAALEAVTGKE